MPQKNKAGLGAALLGRLAQKLKTNRKLEYLIYGVIVVIIIALYVSTLFPKDESAASSISPGQSSTTLSSSEQDVEQRLCNVLSNIRGAGAVQVMITYETGPELVPAMSTDVNSNSSESTGSDGQQNSTQQQTQSSKPATISGSDGSEPIVLTEKQPSVRGVIVVAEGAADVMVRLNLQRAVQTVLDVPAANIEVFEMALQAQD